jgi:hypothetical protein
MAHSIVCSQGPSHQPLPLHAEHVRLTRMTARLALGPLTGVLCACTAPASDAGGNGNDTIAAASATGNPGQAGQSEADDGNDGQDAAKHTAATKTDDGASEDQGDDGEREDDADEDDDDKGPEANGGAPNTTSSDTKSGDASTGGAPTDGAASDPFAASAVCSSGVTGRTSAGSQMRPGEACIACHASSGGPRFAIAGTVYPTAHEPDDCNGASTDTGAVVVITDATGKTHQLKVNQAGNFTLSGSLPLPYTAKVTAGGTDRAMGSAQQSGDCNGCHTQRGNSSAPGRIVLP